MTVRSIQLRELIAVVVSDNSSIPPLNMLELVDEQGIQVRRCIGRPPVWQALKAIAAQLLE